MTVKNNIEDNTSNFPNIKIIVLGVLLATSIIGGLCYYFAGNKKPSEEPVKEVIEENQKVETQPEIIINNGYIPVIDCLWLNIPVFVIVAVVVFFITIFTLDCITENYEFFKCPDPATSKLSLKVRAVIIFIIFHQVIFYIIWFILMFIFASFSKIWDKKHSWWSNVKKGFLRNRIHRGWLSLIPISVNLLLIIFLLLITNTDIKKKYRDKKIILKMLNTKKIN